MFDTWRLKKNAYSYLSQRQVQLNVDTGAQHTQPLMRGGVQVMNFEGNPMMQPYASPVPSRSSSDVYDLFQNGPVGGSYLFPTGISFNANMAGKGHQLNLGMSAVGVQTNIRFLPWGPDACTYMQLDDAAEVWFTGPLSGCNIYSVGNGRQIWVIHANFNQDGDNVQRNNNYKRQVALNVAASFGPATPLWGHLERGATHYNGLGFVFGQWKGNRWQNYYHDGQGTVTLLS